MYIVLLCLDYGILQLLSQLQTKALVFLLMDDDKDFYRIVILFATLFRYGANANGYIKYC